MSAKNKLGKIGNQYADVLDDLYEKIPKAVFAALAVSGLTQGGDYIEDAKKNILEEWRILHQNGIVPQKAIKQSAQTEKGGSGK